MTTVDSWPVEVSLHEEDGQTRAEARLTRDGVAMMGHGLARRNPDDQEVTQTGEDRGCAQSGVIPRLEPPCGASSRAVPGRLAGGHVARARLPTAA